MTRPHARLARLGVVLAAGLAAMALAACGSSGSTTTRTVTRQAPAATGSTTATGGTTETGGTTATGGTTGTARSTAAPAPSASSAPRCVAAGLALSFLGGQGATGHGELGFALRNTSGRRCRTVGYPGVQFLDAAGRALPTHPTHTTHDFFGHTVYRGLVVAPGASVSFRLGVTHGNGSTAGCRTARALQVIAPNDTATLRITIPNGGAYECGTATVSPLQPGESAFS